MKALPLLLLFALPGWLLAADPQPAQLVGHWRFISGERRHDITFARDGTFSDYITQNGKVLYQFAGKWSLHGSKLVYEDFRSSPTPLPPHYRDEDEVLKLSKDLLLIRNREGNEHRWLRVRDR